MQFVAGLLFMFGITMALSLIPYMTEHKEITVGNVLAVLYLMGMSALAFGLAFDMIVESITKKLKANVQSK